MDLSATKSVPAADGVAFGRIKIVWKGEEQQNLTRLFGEKPWSVMLLPDAASTASEYHLSGDGSFYWHLPAGGYAIAAFQGVRPFPSNVQISGRIFSHFDVAPATARYVSTLTLAFDGVAYKLSVDDEFPIAASNFARLFPGIPLTQQKQLMILERRR